MSIKFSLNELSRLLITIKSLPRPCIFVKLSLINSVCLKEVLKNLSDKIYFFICIIAMTTPSKINLNKAKTVLTVTFDDVDYELSAEFLRVYSPSAEVVGHGPGQETLQVDKENVTITNIQPTGNYAIILFFSDGHDTGIYSWSHIHNLCVNKSILWASYLKKLKDAGHYHSQIKKLS